MKKEYISALYLATTWYLAMGAGAVFLFTSFFFPFLFLPSAIYVCLLLGLTLLDYYLLFLSGGSIVAVRDVAPRLSLGDNNPVHIRVKNTFNFTAGITLIDELPEQFQERKLNQKLTLLSKAATEFNYTLRPLSRGEYLFGFVLCYVSSPLKLLQRRIDGGKETAVKVYPSFLQLRKHNLIAISDNSVTGAKKVRRLGHSLEFEKIKSYVPGDDIRTINWKATARNTGLMVNIYTDTRQQMVYCLVDKSRAMKMPFEGLSLLDYSINASLALLNVALLKQDRAGLITFSQKVNDIVAAERRNGQLNHIMEALYKQDTAFQESDYEQLSTFIHRRISQRSCLILFTNFETYASLERQLPYLKRLASRHLLCVVFFQNTLLKEISETQPDSTEGIYIKTIADRFDYEKKQIVKELRRHGIISILTIPQHLTVDIINKYLELKAKQML